MNRRKPFMAGNWKMNLNREESLELARAIAGRAPDPARVEVLVAPPFTSLATVREALVGTPILLAAQNMHWEPQGAFTGEVSPSMLVEAGCTHVILGHSERRSLFAETDEMIDRKAESACKFGLAPIVCIGETLEEREEGRTTAVIETQLRGSLRSFRDRQILPAAVLLAYEPVWAIGTGKTATPDQAQEIHNQIRTWLAGQFDPETSEKVRILYGGSVKPENIKELMAMPDVDGALVGGASLNANSFVPIIRFEF
jgi:triosephosphate isomerase (TIM)